MVDRFDDRGSNGQGLKDGELSGVSRGFKLMRTMLTRLPAEGRRCILDLRITIVLISNPASQCLLDLPVDNWQIPLHVSASG